MFDPLRCESLWGALAETSPYRTDPLLLCDAIREIVELMLALGVPSFITNDILCNVGAVEDAAQLRPNATVEDLFESRLPAAQARRGACSPPPSQNAPNHAFANLLRTITFANAFVARFLVASTPLAAAARGAYDETLSRFHVFPLRFLVRSAVMLLPSRAVFFTRITPANDPAFDLCASLARFKNSVEKVATSLRATLVANNISE